VVKYAKDNIYIVKTLKEFQYIDEEGKDQGSNGKLCALGEEELSDHDHSMTKD